MYPGKKLECNRASTLDYLGNLMEDASDFSFLAILQNPVQGDHDNCFSPGSNSLNPVMTHFVEENSTNISGCHKKRGVRQDNRVNLGKAVVVTPIRTCTVTNMLSNLIPPSKIRRCKLLRNLMVIHYACNKITLHSALFLFMG